MQQDDGMQEPAPWRPRSFLSPARPNQSMKLPETHELGPLNDDKLKDWSTCTAGQFYEYDYFIEPSLVCDIDLRQRCKADMHLFKEVQGSCRKQMHLFEKVKGSYNFLLKC
eukprot:1097065-Pelagomonas_calceolata.AAC.1